ncbi:hypothetical protein B0T20DRAFT_490037 [Sordaria brevicollis]|uniref:Uncharacterized protein n=1 Tax=Sordaria brevicollis TaxID=83679 RepID=A0AAE0U2T3_SORBR|nr:hypothetical protein B0T20DRAFT_490037 [Sordaria brevicollis]
MAVTSTVRGRAGESSVWCREEVRDCPPDDKMMKVLKMGSVRAAFCQSVPSVAGQVPPATQSNSWEMRAAGRFRRKSQHLPRQINDKDIRMYLPVPIMAPNTKNASLVMANLPSRVSYLPRKTHAELPNYPSLRRIALHSGPQQLGDLGRNGTIMLHQLSLQANAAHDDVESKLAAPEPPQRPIEEPKPELLSLTALGRGPTGPVMMACSDPQQSAGSGATVFIRWPAPEPTLPPPRRRNILGTTASTRLFISEIPRPYHPVFWSLN